MSESGTPVDTTTIRTNFLIVYKPLHSTPASLRGLSKSGGSPTKFIQKGAGAASLGGNAKAQPKVSSFAKAKKYAKIYQIIFNSINYKNMGGLRLEIKGRLTKRYRADRSLFKVK